MNQFSVYVQEVLSFFLITRVWICSLPGIKEYPCDSNEALCIINKFQKRLVDKFLISVRPCNILYFILEVFVLLEVLKSYWPKRGIDFIEVIRFLAQQCRSSRSISPVRAEFIHGELHESIQCLRVGSFKFLELTLFSLRKVFGGRNVKCFLGQLSCNFLFDTNSQISSFRFE